MVLGAESMAHGYPLFEYSFNESVLFDNAHKLEGSVLVLLINIVFILTLAILIHKRSIRPPLRQKFKLLANLSAVSLWFRIN